MSKEVKIGLAIIGGLLVVFGVVLFNRLRGPSLVKQDAEESATSTAGSDGEAADDGADADHSQDEDSPRVAAKGEEGAAPASGADLFASSRLTARAGATAGDGRDDPDAPYMPDASDDENDDENAEAGGGEDADDDDGYASSYDSYDSYDRRPASTRRGSNDATRSTAATVDPGEGEESATESHEEGLAHDETEVSATDTAAESDEQAEEYEPEEADDEEYTGRYAAGTRGQAQAEEPVTAQGQTAPAPAEPAANSDDYEVRRGEDLWLISEALFGTDIYARAIYAHNRDAYPNPDAIRAGDVLVIPEAAELERLYPETFPREAATAQAGPNASQPAVAAADSTASDDEYMADDESSAEDNTGTAVAARPASRPTTDDRVYLVREGETIFDVARNELGKARRWVEIYELNRDVLGDDFQTIPAGTELLLPPENQADATARRPRETPR